MADPEDSTDVSDVTDVSGVSDDEVDDATANLAVFPDAAPKSGQWVDNDDVLANPTEDEVEEGRRLAEEIDPDDDDSTGVPEVQ